MAKQECPNCGEYKWEREKTSNRSIGCFIMFGGLVLGSLISGAAEAFGGTVSLGVWGLVFGIPVLLFGLWMFFGGGQKKNEITYFCTHCNYAVTYDKKTGEAIEEHDL